jgi:glycosyltransferase involved in cell wall biosynthesis
MRILQLRSAFEDSGPGTQSLTIATELRRRGHVVSFCGSGGLLAPLIRDTGFEFETIRSLALDRRDPVNAMRAIFAIARLLKKEGIEVVHAHNAAATYLAWMASNLGLHPVRLVHSVRGIELRESHSWRNWIYKLYPADMLAVSEFTRRELIRLGADGRRIHVTYNGTNLDRFDPDKVSGQSIRSEFGLEHAIVLGHVGAFSGAKGQQNIVRVVARLVNRYPRIRALLVGVGAARPNVEKLAEDLGVAEKVVFAGFRTDIPQFQAAFDIYLQPSTWGEMFPNAIVEAMSMRNPWVGSDISGLAELTADGGAGTVVPPDDIDALVAAIEPLVASPELRLLRGTAGRLEVEERFTIGAVVDRIETVYNRSSI